MTSKKVVNTDAKDNSIIKRNKVNNRHNNHSLNNTNEEFATELGVNDNSSEKNPVSERSAWN
ncbi:MAG TPA: hypothetical protein IAA29_17445 [Candidatus Paenibacillus intestinavium]|nr:hypothetical protein [Candidatus Paenibacillus intestinavium]